MSDDVNIRISATDNATAILRAVQGELSKFSASVKGIAALTLSGIGLQQVGSFLAGTLREVAEAEKSQAKLQSVLRATGNTTKLTFAQISEFTDNLEKTTGTSGDSLTDAAANLSRFANITGEQFKDVLSLANDMSVVLGGDVTSSVKTLASALNSPADGLSKLSGLGITFNEVQKEQIKLLDGVGMKAQAQAKILDEIRRQFGGAGAEFGKTTAGQLEIMNARISDLRKAIGESLAPTVISLLEVINQSMGNRAGASANAQALLERRNGAIGGGDTELSRLKELRNALKEVNAEDKAIRERAKQDGLLFGVFLSPFRAGADAGKRISNRVAREDLREQIVIQEARARFAVRQDINNTPAELARGAVANLLGTIAGAASGAAIGNIMGRAAEIAATDAGSLVGRRLYSILSDQSSRQKADPVLQATESRFLTRGRGQLSPAEQKNLEEQKKQTALLERIERDLNNLPTGMMLIVEGVN